MLWTCNIPASLHHWVLMSPSVFADTAMAGQSMSTIEGQCGYPMSFIGVTSKSRHDYKIAYHQSPPQHGWWLCKAGNLERTAQLAAQRVGQC